MLLRFSVSNYLCFAEEQTLSLVASNDTSHPSHIVGLRQNYKYQALRSAALYGANAHGKTKLVEAMAFAQEFIVEGRKPDQPIGIKPFRLDPELLNSPSRFEFVIFYDNIEYTYGFVIDNKKVLEEWLFARPNVREVKYFERITDKQGNVTVEIGASLLKNQKPDEKQYIEFIARGTRENQLFLTEAVERKQVKLKPVYDWFSQTLVVYSSELPLQPVEMRANKESDFINFMGNFLQLADTGISNVFTKEEPIEFESIKDDNLKKRIKNLTENQSLGFLSLDGKSFSISLNRDKEPVAIRLKTNHLNSLGNSIVFDFHEESSGTQRLMHILPVLADSIDNTKVYIIDEIDRKLHPALSKLFLQFFLEKSTTSQLIFTTHETHLLDLDILRRDEIWFVEKNKLGRSHLYSLAEFKIRPDLKIEKGYLQGRFGAIPFVGNISNLGW